jgi:hypothetical protein
VPAGLDANAVFSTTGSNFRLQWVELASLPLLALDQLTWNEPMSYCKPLPPLGRIKYLLALRSDGCLIWKRPSSNRARPGQVAGRWNKGYRFVNIDGQAYAIHRIAWALHNKIDPGQMEIDHINGDPSDNRPINLRACTHKQNTLNVKNRKDNISGIRGVSYDPSSTSNPWRAHIRNKKLGRFATIDQAAQALKNAVEQDQDQRFYHRQSLG